MAKPRTRAKVSSVHGMSVRDLCGWVPDEERAADFAMVNGTVSQVAPHLLAGDRKDVYLWLPMLKVNPRWQRDAQGIGDCVAWGWEIVMTCLMSIQDVQGISRFLAPAATEPCYGGARVEALGKKRGGRSDGAFGAAAAKWGRDWGVILRVDMSKETGIAEHDLRRYSAEKAKDWGDYGCGGKNDTGLLDGAARAQPVQHVVAVTDVMEAAAAIQNGYPITIASMAGFGRMERDASGICEWVDEWAHQMAVLGVRWRGGEPQFRVFQSWGPKTCSGPDPGITDPAISGCSWWIRARTMERILKSGDCWVHGSIAGLPKQTIPLAEPASRWSRPDHKPRITLAV